MIATNSVLSAASAPSARSSVQTRAQAAAKGFQARSAGSLSGRSLSVAGAAAPCVLRAAESRKSSVRVRAAAEGSELEALGAVKVICAKDGSSVNLTALVDPSKRTLVPFFTQFGDFDSWELAQRLVDFLPQLDQAGVAVVGVGIGTLEAARFFSERTGFPLDRLYADPDGYAYTALGFEPGCGRPGGALPFLSNIAAFNGYASLLLMCAGVGSPGTLKEVFRGYLGDRTAEPVFKTGSNVDLPWKAAFNLVGQGFQRPFELATLRLNNMAAILGNWKPTSRLLSARAEISHPLNSARQVLTPEDSNLLVQRGGVLLFEGGKAVWRHDDAGILGYAKPERVVARAVQADPSRVADPAGALRLGAEARRAAPQDLYESIRFFERNKGARPAFDAQSVNGQWRLQFTTGTAEKAANANKRGGGSYFPIKAVQSFNAATGHIRNGVYLGPVAFYFDGPYVWDDRLKILEFNFDRVSLQFGETGTPLRFNIGGDAWAKLKKAEEGASGGQGDIGKAAGKAAGGGKRKVNPFFKFVYADPGLIAARGRGGGLAMWARCADAPVEVDEEYRSTRMAGAAAKGAGAPAAR